MWMAAGRMRDMVRDDPNGRRRQEQLWRESVQRAGELLAAGWSQHGSCREEYDALDVLALLVYVLSETEGSFSPRRVPIETMIEALDQDRDGERDGGEALIREGLVRLGHDPHDEHDSCFNTLNSLTTVHHQEYYEPAMGTWDDYPSDMVPFFGSWTNYARGADLAQRVLKRFHGPGHPDIITRYPVLAGSEITDLHRLLARLADDNVADAELSELRAEAQRTGNLLQLRCREMNLPI